MNENNPLWFSVKALYEWLHSKPQKKNEVLRYLIVQSGVNMGLRMTLPIGSALRNDASIVNMELQRILREVYEVNNPKVLP